MSLNMYLETLIKCAKKILIISILFPSQPWSLDLPTLSEEEKSFKEKGWGVKLLISGRDHQRICLSLDIFAGFNPLLNKGTTEIQYTPS